MGRKKVSSISCSSSHSSSSSSREDLSVHIFAFTSAKRFRFVSRKSAILVALAEIIAEGRAQRERLLKRMTCRKDASICVKLTMFVDACAQTRVSHAVNGSPAIPDSTSASTPASLRMSVNGFRPSHQSRSFSLGDSKYSNRDKTLDLGRLPLGMKQRNSFPSLRIKLL
jgi:hypothetical protein